MIHKLLLNQDLKILYRFHAFSDVFVYIYIYVCMYVLDSYKWQGGIEGSNSFAPPLDFVCMSNGGMQPGRLYDGFRS